MMHNSDHTAPAKLGFSRFSYPLGVHIARARGVWLFAASGKRLLDCLSSYCAANFGHRHPMLLKILRQQSERVGVLSSNIAHGNIAFLRSQLAELVGAAEVLVLPSGVDAVEGAIKTMRLFGYRMKRIPEGKAKIIAFDGCYHGQNTGILGITPLIETSKHCGPFMPGLELCRWGDIGHLRELADENCCGIIIEPIQCQNGFRVPPEGFLQQVQAVCRERNVLFCVDEIQSGMGRSGHLFRYQRDGLAPDIILIGKSLGGGLLPVSALVLGPHATQHLQLGDHGNTFADYPMGSAMACSTLRMANEPWLLENATRTGARLRTEIQSFVVGLGLTVRNEGLFVTIDTDQDTTEFCGQMLKYGILCKPTRKKSIRVCPPLTINKSETEFLLERLQLGFSKAWVSR